MKGLKRVALAILAPGLLAGCAYAVMGAVAGKAITKERMPNVRSWGNMVQMTPTGLGFRLPADSISWETTEGRTRGGESITVLDGTAYDGERAQVHLMWDEARNCGSWNKVMFDGVKVRVHEKYLSPDQRAVPIEDLPDLASWSNWKPADGSGWKSAVYLLHETEMACFKDGTRPLVVYVRFINRQSSLHDGGIERGVRTLLWVVGDAARTQRGRRG